MVRSEDDRPRTVKKPAKRQPARKPRPKPKMMQGPYRELLRGVVTLVEQGRISAIRSVNTVLTSTYWLVGRRIVEHEQSGAERAAYGETLLKRLAHDLTAELGRGFSERNLEQMRLFYLGWSISQTVSAKFVPPPISQTVSAKSALPTIRQTPSAEIRLAQLSPALVSLRPAPHCRRFQCP